MPLPDHTLLDQCPICSSEKHALWRRKNGYDVVRCSGCGFLFTRDHPSVEFLRRYYAPGYAGADGRYQPAESLGRKLKYRLFAWWIKRFYPKQKIHALELGCGQGDFLSTVQADPRFDAQGLDYADAPLAYARSRGLNVQQGDIQGMNFPEASFDLVIALQVLEHVHDLGATVTEIHRVLREGGLLFAVCPCVTHLKARIAGARWKYFGPPDHLWYFSPSTLSRLLRSHGFTILMASCFYHRAHVRVLARKKSPG